MKSDDLKSRLAAFDQTTTKQTAHVAELRDRLADLVAAGDDQKASDKLTREVAEGQAALDARGPARSKIEAQLAEAVAAEKAATEARAVEQAKAYVITKDKGGAAVAAAIRNLGAVIREHVGANPFEGLPQILSARAGSGAGNGELQMALTLRSVYIEMHKAFSDTGLLLPDKLERAAVFAESRGPTLTRLLGK